MFVSLGYVMVTARKYSGRFRVSGSLFWWVLELEGFSFGLLLLGWAGFLICVFWFAGLLVGCWLGLVFVGEFSVV